MSKKWCRGREKIDVILSNFQQWQPGWAYIGIWSCTAILHLIILSLLYLKYSYFGSHQYAKVVVFSKVPLPNYRSDLDEKRPQREVFSRIYFMFGKKGWLASFENFLRNFPWMILSSNGWDGQLLFFTLDGCAYFLKVLSFASSESGVIYLLFWLLIGDLTFGIAKRSRCSTQTFPLSKTYEQGKFLR